MHEETANSVILNRSVRRTILKDLRTKHKELLLGNKRLRLHDVSEYLHDVTLSEFSELLLKLKQKTVPLELLRKIKNSCVSIEYIEAVLRNDGSLNSLIRFLIGNDAQKQLESAACLTNIACGSHKCSYKVAKTSGAYLVSFTTGSSHFLQEQSSWALANIANDCLKCFNIIKSQGVLSALLKAIESPLPSVQQSAVIALNACTKYEDTEVISVIQSGFPKRLLSLMEQDSFNKYILLDAAFTLSNCCFLSAKYSLGVIDIEGVKSIINILLKVIQDTEIDILIATPLIRCVGFLSYDDKICEFVALHPEFIRSIQIIITKEDYLHLAKEAIWVLSNVMASRSIVSNISDLMLLIDNLKIILEVENSVTLQVLYCLSILASKNESLNLKLKEHESFAQIKCLLEREDKDVVNAATVFLEIVDH